MDGSWKRMIVSIMTPREIFREIVRLADGEKFEQSKSMFEQAVAQFPQHGQVWERLALYCKAQLALDQNPDHARSCYSLGVVLANFPDWFGERKDSLRKAENLYRRSMKLGPLSSLPHYGLANLLSKNPGLFFERDESLLQAETHYRKAIKLEPGLAELHNGLANLLAQHPRLFGHENVALRQAERFFSEAIQLDPSIAQPHNGLGNLLSNHPALFGELNAVLLKAEAHYRSAIEIDPNFAYAYCGLARLLGRQPTHFGERHVILRQAMVHYVEAIDRDSSLANAHYGLAVLLTESPTLFGEHSAVLLQAETHFRAAIELEPSASNPHNGLASLLVLHPALFGQNAAVLLQAETHFQASIALDPKSSAPLNGLANLLKMFPSLFSERIESLLSAKTHYCTAIGLDPKDAYPRHGLATLLGKHHTLFGERNETLRLARTHYIAAIKLQPDFADPHNGLGSLLAGHPDVFGERNESFLEAETQYQKAIGFDRSFPSPWYGLAFLYRQKDMEDLRIADGCFRRWLCLDRAAPPSSALKAAEIFPHPLVYLELLQTSDRELSTLGNTAPDVLSDAEPFLDALRAVDQAELGAFEGQEMQGLIRHLGGDVRGAFEILDELDSYDEGERNLGLQWQLSEMVARRLGDHLPERQFALDTVAEVEKERALTAEEAYYAGCLLHLGDFDGGGTAAIIDHYKNGAKVDPAIEAAARRRFEQAEGFLPASYQLWDSETDTQRREERMRAILAEERHRAASGQPTLLLFRPPVLECGNDKAKAQALVAGVRQCVLLAQLQPILLRFYEHAAASHARLLEEIAALAGGDATFLPKPGEALTALLEVVGGTPQPSAAELRERLQPMLDVWNVTESVDAEDLASQIAKNIKKDVVSHAQEGPEAPATWFSLVVQLYLWEERIEVQQAVDLLLYLRAKIDHEQRHHAAYGIPRLGKLERNALRIGVSLLGGFLGGLVPVDLSSLIFKTLGLFAPDAFGSLQRRNAQRRFTEFPGFDEFHREFGDDDTDHSDVA